MEYLYATNYGLVSKIILSVFIHRYSHKCRECRIFRTVSKFAANSGYRYNISSIGTALPGPSTL